MRRILGILVLLAAVVVIAALAWWSTGSTAVNSGGLYPAPTDPPPVSVNPGKPVDATDIPIPEDAVAATINYVHDGDTLFVSVSGNSNLKVRLLAVDTPEVGANAECFGDEARARLRSLLPEGSTVYLAADVEPTDQYDRALRFLWTSSGELVNLSLVEDGYAEAVFIGANRWLEDEVEAAEDAAQAAGVGIWGEC